MHSYYYKLSVTLALRIPFCLTFLLITSVATSQWKVYQFEPKKVNVKSLLPSKKNLKDGYTFFGSSFDYNEDVIKRGYEPFLRDTSWEIQLTKPLSPFKSNFYFNLYSVNVLAVKVRVYEKNGNCYEKKITFSRDGYQLPFEWSLEESSKVSGRSGENNSKPVTISSPIFCASIELRDSSLSYKFVVGDAKVYEKSFEKKPSQGYWFYEITKNKENRLSSYIRRKFGNSYPLKQDVHFVAFNGSSFNFELNQKNIDTIVEQKATLQLIRSIFQKYPYYNEHLLNQEETIASIDKIIADSLPYHNKIELLEKKAEDLHDAHFYFQIVDKENLKISSPLILKLINNSVQVVGIRDERLKSRIDLGDKLYEVNNVASRKFIDSLSYEYFGNLSQRRELAISHLLEKPLNSASHNITLEKPSGIFYTVNLEYDKKFSVPNRFIPKHYGFYRLENHWVYLKINKWDNEDWINFYNLKDSILNSTGIIFDLRGNPGGFEIETIKIASCFLKKPFVYSSETYSTQHRVYSGQTIIKPNRYLNLSDLKTIILVDNKTACASESFALALKKITGATIIGTSKTGSSFSTAYFFRLPENINLSINILGKTYILNQKEMIEYKGIQPDIIVDINKVTDLYGYEDKVLQTAHKEIDRSMQ